MSRTHQTLISLFNDIADSIREKTGSTSNIVADNFPSEIANIQTGFFPSVKFNSNNITASSTGTLTNGTKTYNAVVKSDNKSNFYLEVDKITDLGEYTYRITDADKVAEGTINIKQPVNYNIDVELIGVLPSEYQEVEYIEATGTQFINLNYNIGSNSGIFIKYTNGTHNKYIYGRGGTAWRDNKMFALLPQENYHRLYYGTASYDMNVSNEMNVELKNKILKVNNTIVNTFTNSITNSNTNFYLFAFTYGTGSLEYGIGRIHSLKLYENDTLVRNYVPCYHKNSGTIGMYELVEGIFYTNDGTGVFEKGTDV